MLAFTLAELLITMAIIGIVSVLVLPALIQRYNEKSWGTAHDVIQKKLVEVTRRMNSDGLMSGVSSTTENFIRDFKKYMKITKVCDASYINDCYPISVISTDSEDIEVNILSSSKTLGHNEWATATVGFNIVDGTIGIMAYNPNCPYIDPISAEAQAGQELIALLC